MDVETAGAWLGTYAGTLAVCFVSGLVPVVNAEIWLVAVTITVAAPEQLPLIVVLAATGQVGAKVVLYYAAMGAVSVPTGRFRARVERARGGLQAWNQRPHLVLLASASVGLPPFYLTSLLAGALKYSLRAFVTLGMLGRTSRFGVIVAAAWMGTS